MIGTHCGSRLPTKYGWFLVFKVFITPPKLLVTSLNNFRLVQFILWLPYYSLLVPALRFYLYRSSILLTVFLKLRFQSW